MRGLFLFLPVVLMAQTPPPKAPATAPAAAPKAPAKSATTPAGITKTGTPAPKKAAPATTTTMTPDEEKTFYAIGLSISRSLSQFDLSAAEIELVKKALSDAAAGKPA